MPHIPLTLQKAYDGILKEREAKAKQQRAREAKAKQQRAQEAREKQVRITRSIF